MLNQQLQRHLDEFSDETLEEPAVPRRSYLHRISGRLLAEARRKGWRINVHGSSVWDTLFIILWLLPLYIVIVGYGWLLLCLTFATSGVLLYIHVATSPDSSANDDAAEVDNMQQTFSVTHLDSERSAYMAGFDETEAINLKLLRDCRLTVTHLLGLVGAPPLDMLHNVTQAGSASFLQGGRNDAIQIKIPEAVTKCIVDFAQANVELLLVLDRAYHWLQVTSSIHMGLGPLATCIERAERAALGREYTKYARHEMIKEQSQREDQTNAETRLPLEPNNNFGVSRIIALASVRRNLTSIIVKEIRSLTCVIDIHRVLNVTEDGTQIDQSRESTIEIPDIITLSWMKSSRQKLASALRCALQAICTLENFELLSLPSGSSGRSALEDSTWSARESKAYIVSHLLLDNTDDFNWSSERYPLIMEHQITPDSLVHSMLQFREHIDALRCTLQGCLHSCCASPSHTDTGDQREWWAQVRKLSGSVRVLEAEINDMFFLPSKVHKEIDAINSVMTPAFDQIETPDSGSYEHNVTPALAVSSAAHVNNPILSKSTLVFSGHGTICEPESSPRKGQGSSARPLQRDTIAEHLLVTELQNRIRRINPPTEVELGCGSLIDATDLDQINAGASHEEKKTVQESFHFLGATGSLLGELKSSLKLATNSKVSQQWEVEE